MRERERRSKLISTWEGGCIALYCIVLYLLLGDDLRRGMGSMRKREGERGRGKGRRRRGGHAYALTESKSLEGISL